MWIKERRLAKLLINGTVAGRHKIDDKISNLEVMNNLHSLYQIGKKSGSGKTFAWTCEAAQGFQGGTEKRENNDGDDSFQHHWYV